MENFDVSDQFEFRVSAWLEEQRASGYSELLELPAFRDLLVKDRFSHLFRGEIRSIDSGQATKNTTQHNADYARMFYKEMSRRPDLICKPLGALNSVVQNAHRMRVLAIGPRTEAEIFALVNIGFRSRNIHALDLISYSPMINLGDAHAIAVDHSFDVVVCGWVLEFSTHPEQIVRQIDRVTHEKSIICIGGMHHPDSIDLGEYNRRKEHADRRWYASVEKIMSQFGIDYTHILFKSDIDSVDKEKRGDIVVIFRKGKN